ncbi:hypothetical protein CTI12_AA412890 [Artemisia annua]|uniref:Uncharacterized protein n=1 Tax=Artemisia annua TaxID=35608 RepID=A0A2U1M743_ARTAN|nr:hypothetical protein CTI12_AA412890 [Artemisia annua]
MRPCNGFYLVESSRAHKILPRVHKILPPALPAIRALVLPTPPSTRELSGRYQKYNLRAFRPTCPGPSPGVGHGIPPGDC